jgi:hypothetical protein
MNRKTGKPKVITRDEAIAAGLPRYFNGKPCPHGHVSERHVCNRVCTTCLKEQCRGLRGEDRSVPHGECT